ncbi:MAG: preprotein translocase subunit YajC [Bacteroidetes bacterium]|nr:preprotein translocase subunit YajC [Bacteroidota bacterium]
MNFDVLFLQTSGGGAGAGYMNLVFIAAMVVIFYLFLIRPQSKRQKEQKLFSESIEKGSEIVTTSGILGRINKIEDDIVTLEVGTKTFIRITRSSISKEMTDAIYSANDKNQK